MKKSVDLPKEGSQADKAYSYIRSAIFNGTFHPGYPVTEIDLCNELGMSRTPIREAINRLKAEGLLETIHRKGVFVKNLTKEEIRQIYEMAEGLEGMVVYLVAQSLDQSGIEKLERQISGMEKSLQIGDMDQWILSDLEFHQTLYSICANSYLIDTLNLLNLRIHLTRVTVIRAFVDKKKSTKDHRLAFEAIRSGDSRKARQITQDHWKRVREDILRYL